MISDTGTSLIIGPKQVVHSLAKAIGGMSWDGLDGLYLVPCDRRYAPIILHISGISYELEDEVLSINAGDLLQPNLCIFGIIPYDSSSNLEGRETNFRRVNFIFAGSVGPEWILGDPFIRQYCRRLGTLIGAEINPNLGNIHDIGNKRMGFAKAKRKK